MELVTEYKKRVYNYYISSESLLEEIRNPLIIQESAWDLLHRKILAWRHRI